MKEYSYNPHAFDKKIYQLNADSKIADIKDGIHQMPLGDGLMLDFLFQGFEKHFKEKVVLVCLSGAISNRDGKEAPFFSGINVSRELKLPLVSISDPSLALDSKLPIAWYAGNFIEKEIPSIVAAVLDKIASEFEAKLYLFGGSCGGYAALRLSHLLASKHAVFVWNPQTSISKYDIRFAKMYCKSAFPNDYEMAGSPDDEANVAEFLKKMGITDSLCDSPIGDHAEIFYIQNESDWHVDKHAMPYIKGLGLSQSDNNFYTNGKNCFVMFGDWGVGHSQPKKDLIIDVLRRLIGNKDKALIARDIISIVNFTKEEKYSEEPQLGPRSVDEPKKKMEMLAMAWQSNGFVITMAYLLCDKAVVPQINYAFYLYVNGVRASSIWYQGNNIHEFVLDVKDNPADTKIKSFSLDGAGNKTSMITAVSSLYGRISNGSAYLAINNFKRLDGYDYALRLLDEAGNIFDIEEIADDIVLREVLKNRKISVSKNIKFYRSISKVGAVKSLKFQAVIGAVIIDIPWADSRISLDLLRTENSDEFMSRFTYASNRHLDTETTMEIAKNNLSVNSIAPFIYINSAVIYSYKVVELSFFEKHAESALGYLDVALSKVNEIENGFGARNDNVHFYVSLLTAKMHILLFSSSWGELLDCGELIFAEFLSKEFRAYYSVNLAKTFYIAAVSAYKLSRHDRYAVFLKSILSVEEKMNAAIANNEPGWLYTEKKYITELSEKAKYLISSRKVSLKDLDAGLRLSSRVKAVSYLDKLSQNLKAS